MFNAAVSAQWAIVIARSYQILEVLILLTVLVQNQPTRRTPMSKTSFTYSLLVLAWRCMVRVVTVVTTNISQRSTIHGTPRKAHLLFQSAGTDKRTLSRWENENSFVRKVTFLSCDLMLAVK